MNAGDVKRLAKTNVLATVAITLAVAALVVAVALVISGPHGWKDTAKGAAGGIFGGLVAIITTLIGARESARSAADLTDRTEQRADEREVRNERKKAYSSFLDAAIALRLGWARVNSAAVLTMAADPHVTDDQLAAAQGLNKAALDEVERLKTELNVKTLEGKLGIPDEVRKTEQAFLEKVMQGEDSEDEHKALSQAMLADLSR